MGIETDSGPDTATGVYGLIDVHTHFPTPAYHAAVERAGAPGGDSVLPAWNAEQTLDISGDVGIEYSVLSPMSSLPVFADAGQARRAAREFNEELADQVADDPLSFGGVALLPLPHVDATLEELAYALDVLKLDGAHVVTSYAGRYPSDPAFAPLLEELDRRGTTVMTHPIGPLDASLEGLFETTRLAFCLLAHGALERYPNIKWILAHGGATILQTGHLLREAVRAARPETTDLTEPLADGEVRDPVRNCYVDVVGNSDEPMLSGLAALLGPERLVFGSDLPVRTGAEVARAIVTFRDNAAVDDDVKKAITCENAMRLFPSVARKLQRLAGGTTVCNDTDV